MEYIDIYDENKKIIKESVNRETKLNPHEYVKVIHVWLKNGNDYLIQKRAKESDPNPFMWATTSGSVLSKETPLDAAHREVQEELGLTLNNSALSLLKVITSKRGIYHTICYVYYASINVDINDLVLDETEVKAVKYEPLNTIKTMIKQGSFWDYEYLMKDPNYFKMLESK